MGRITVTGNGALAEKLNVSKGTVSKWRKNGVLDPATISHYGKIIIYDLEKVYECLNHRPVKAGRRAAI